METASRENRVPERLLATDGGARRLTDLRHLAEVLHDAATVRQLGGGALLDWLRDRVAEARRDKGAEGSRRLETDGSQVTVVTIHRSKGLEYPVVYLPDAYDRWVPDDDGGTLLTHPDGDRGCGRRSAPGLELDVGGKHGPGRRERFRRYGEEQAAEDLRLLYVALTRAQCQVVTWWARRGTRRAPRCSGCSGASATGRRRRVPADARRPDDRARPRAARRAGDASTPGRLPPPSATRDRPRPTSRSASASSTARSTWPGAGPRTPRSPPRRTGWTSPPRASPASPSRAGRTTRRRPAEARRRGRARRRARRRPRDGACRRGRGPRSPSRRRRPLGRRVADGRAAERRRLRDGGARRPRGGRPGRRRPGRRGADACAALLARTGAAGMTADQLADGLLPAFATPLGPLADDRALADVPARDRLAELELRAAARRRRRPTPGELRLGDLAPLLRRHLRAGRPARRVRRPPHTRCWATSRCAAT